ncbi:hypothetical protein ACIRU3_39240 [Streptomyces sp. NPDC101151]|uniref:hypothetical protein n=1 Tax=Streptomyces sp. NPDC101151 TaxID=3366115 RepID=UPI00381202AA
MRGLQGRGDTRPCEAPYGVVGHRLDVLDAVPCRGRALRTGLLEESSTCRTAASPIARVAVGTPARWKAAIISVQRCGPGQKAWADSP